MDTEPEGPAEGDSAAAAMEIDDDEPGSGPDEPPEEAEEPQESEAAASQGPEPDEDLYQFILGQDEAALRQELRGRGEEAPADARLVELMSLVATALGHSEHFQAFIRRGPE